MRIIKISSKEKTLQQADEVSRSENNYSTTHQKMQYKIK